MDEMEKPTPRFDRMTTVYNYMQKTAVTEKALDYFRYDVPTDVEEISIWRGFTKDIAEVLEIKKYLVDQAMQQLIFIESIRRMYKGSHGHPSIFHIIESP